MQDLEAVLIVGVVFAGLGWIFRTFMVARRQQKIAALQAEMQGRVLDKFSSPQEFMGYLESGAGQQFLESATLDKVSPYGRILGAIQSGVILLLVGIAILIFRSQVADSEGGLLFLGCLMTALGLGFVISAAVSHLLASRWGLLEKGPGGGPRP